MARPALYSTDQMLDAVVRLARRQGPGAVSVVAVAEELGCPSGSIYHRFSGRDELLTAAWLRAAQSFHDGFLAALGAPGDPVATGTAAALGLLDAARRRPADSQLVMLYRRSELTRGPWPGPAAARAAALGSRLTDALRRFGERMPQVPLDRVRFALVDVPQAAIRNAHVTGGVLDRSADANVSHAVTALLTPATASIAP